MSVNTLKLFQVNHQSSEKVQSNFDLFMNLYKVVLLCVIYDL